MPRVIVVVGGGPAGLYASSQIKRDDPAAEVIVLEQNPEDSTFGFGVVFAKKALDFLRANDPDTCDLIEPNMERWRNMTFDHQGHKITIDGTGFYAIDRLLLLRLLQKQALSRGVKVVHNAKMEDVNTLQADVIIGADGADSIVRGNNPDFGIKADHFSNYYAWFGAPCRFDKLTQTILQTDYGVMNAYHFRHATFMSTFVIECNPQTFTAASFDKLSEADYAVKCQLLFKETLGDAPLLTNQSEWKQFPKLWCENWTSGNRVLIGDAAHTTHYSIGAGTRLALEDAQALAIALREHSSVSAALQAYESARKPVVKKLVSASNSSALWYDNFANKMEKAPIDLCFDYITRFRPADRDRLRKTAPLFARAYEAHKQHGNQT